MDEQREEDANKKKRKRRWHTLRSGCFPSSAVRTPLLSACILVFFFLLVQSLSASARQFAALTAVTPDAANWTQKRQDVRGYETLGARTDSFILLLCANPVVFAQRHELLRHHRKVARKLAKLLLQMITFFDEKKKKKKKKKKKRNVSLRGSQNGHERQSERKRERERERERESS